MIGALPINKSTLINNAGNTTTIIGSSGSGGGVLAQATDRPLGNSNGVGADNRPQTLSSLSRCACSAIIFTCVYDADSLRLRIRARWSSAFLSFAALRAFSARYFSSSNNGF